MEVHQREEQSKDHENERSYSVIVVHHCFIQLARQAVKDDLNAEDGKPSDRSEKGRHAGAKLGATHRVVVSRRLLNLFEIFHIFDLATGDFCQKQDTISATVGSIGLVAG